MNRSYRASNISWQFSGCIDVLDNRYEGSPHQAYHRIVSSGKHTWLVLRALAVSGTGVYQINEAWHEIDHYPPKKVLEYPIKGHSAQGDLCDRVFGSRIVNQQRVNSVYVIEIQLSVTYGLGRPVFSKTQTASYVWVPDLAEFVFDQSNSKISKQEMELVYNTGFLKDELFMSYNYSDLKRIASHGNKVQKDWLEWVLTKTEDVPQKRPLLDRLRR